MTLNRLVNIGGEGETTYSRGAKVVEKVVAEDAWFLFEKSDCRPGEKEGWVPDPKDGQDGEVNSGFAGVDGNAAAVFCEATNAEALPRVACSCCGG